MVKHTLIGGVRGQCGVGQRAGEVGLLRCCHPIGWLLEELKGPLHLAAYQECLPGGQISQRFICRDDAIPELEWLAIAEVLFNGVEVSFGTIALRRKD